MEQRRFGNTGLTASVVGLGCSNFGGRTDAVAARAVIAKALDLGITFLDTADFYGRRGGSESCLGEILGDRRKDIVLATKFGQQMDESSLARGTSRRYIMMAIEASLRRLKTDWIDLYQIHWPDPSTPVEETLRALDDLIRQGKVRYIGCSNFTAWQITDAAWTARIDDVTPFISAQNEYSLLVREAEREILPAVQTAGIGFLPYLPLASGLLTGKYKRGAPLPPDARLAASGPNADRVALRQADKFLTDANWAMLERLENFASARGKNLLALGINWLAAQPSVVSVIAGATKPEQVEQNVAAMGWRLSAEELAEIDKIAAS
jgi:aryl-alcohol dehydrogenase-like predicted oxidoreductase